MHTNNHITIFCIVNNYSGAARCSHELMNVFKSCDKYKLIYAYIGDTNISELIIENIDNITIAHFPLFRLCSLNKEITILSLMIHILSAYIDFGNKIIIHDNGQNNIIDNGYIKDKRYIYLHSIHFCPLDESTTKNLSKFNSIICVTRYAQNYIKKLSNRNSNLIYNGVGEVLLTYDRLEVREHYAFGAYEILVLCVGRIEESKGIGLLAKIFSEIGRSDIRLVVVGDGAYDIVFEQIKANHAQITFLGKVDNDEVHNLMAACDIGVIPSLNEQCSYVALEMMSHGMAIIASEVRGMGELFLGRDIALTVPVDYKEDDVPILNEEVLMQHIITLAGDAELRKRLGENAHREWAEKYTAERMARETMEVYRELAAQF